MPFSLGVRSRLALVGVHPRLAEVVRLAIKYSGQDFRVHEGVRDRERQRRLYSSGASRTMQSKHLIQPDGYGHAVDLVPLVDGDLRWEWPLIYPIAEAMHRAAEELNVPLTWGGVWDRPFLALSRPALRLEVRHYQERHPGPDFIDGPHYQIGEP